MRAVRDFFRFPAMGAAVCAATVTVGSLLAAQPARSQSVAEQIVGVYSLAEYSPHGDEPTGRISYDTAGRMWAMLMPPGREPLSGESTDADYRSTMRGVVAYYGTYEIDEPTGRVIHHVEAASNPAWIGDDFVRWFRFDGPDLVISLNEDFEGPLLWRRLPELAPAAGPGSAR